METETKNTLENALHFVNFRILRYQFLVSWDSFQTMGFFVNEPWDFV